MYWYQKKKLYLLQLRFCFVFAILWCVFVGGVPAHGNELVPEKKQLRIAVMYTQEPPYLYTSNRDEYEGILPVLAQTLAEELQLEIVYVLTSRKGLEHAVLNNKADMTWLAPQWVTNKENILFSDPILAHKEFLFSFSSFEGEEGPFQWLEAKTVCVKEGFHYPGLAPFFKLNVAQPVEVSHQGSLFKLFQNGRCDLLFLGNYQAIWAKNSFAEKRKIWRSAQPLSNVNLSFVFSDKWLEKMPDINRAIAKIKNSGKLEAIVSRYAKSQSASEFLLD